MALPFLPSKRPFERHPSEPNGRGKWQKTSSSASQSSQFKIQPGSVVFRLLCPSSKSGSVIGKGGSIVAKIRHETGAKIKLEEIIPGCDERVVVISGSAKDPEFRNEQTKQDDSDSNVDGGENGKTNEEDGKEKDDSTITEDSKSVNATPLVLKALLLIFERIVEGEMENDDADESNKKTSPSIRLLVFPNQVGCLLGKGGSVIKQMSTESGAQIRILPRDKLPLCASPNDEIVQIAGGVDSIRKALQAISQQLMENPPRDRDFPSDNPSGSSSHPHTPIPRPEVFNSTNYHMPVQGGSPFPNRPPFDAPDLPSFPKFHEGAVPGQMQVTPEALVFRLLCSNDKVGSVIGKGGNIVKNIQHETGCEIKIMENSSETENRVVVISGPAVSGEFGVVQEAILQITARLRGHLFRDKTSALNHPPRPAFHDQMPPFGSYMGRDLSPPILYGGLPPFQKDAGARVHEERSAFAHPIHGSGVSPLGAERVPPAPWAPQAMREGGGPMPAPEFAGPLSRRMGGFPGGNQPTLMTHTTVDVVVPRALVPSIYGEDGGCLRRIREISDAKITITEPRPEAKETVILISGTPEQTHAAQSLLQAFVLSETTAP